MSTVVTVGALVALIIGVVGSFYFWRLARAIAHPQVIVFRGHVYEQAGVGPDGEPRLRRIY